MLNNQRVVAPMKTKAILRGGMTQVVDTLVIQHSCGKWMNMGPLWMNYHMIYLLEMIVLYSYIKLPEGVCIQHYYRDDLWNSEIDAEYIPIYRNKFCAIPVSFYISWLNHQLMT